MFTEMGKRTYSQGKRAQQAAETRQRIVEAAAELHEVLGPANTTISAIAERAGVQRLTVYRHFPDDRAIFVACTAHWLTQNPPPDHSEWQDVQEPVQRAVTALKRLYAYYTRTQGMLHKTYRDIEVTPALAEPFAGLEAWLDSVRDDLLAQWKYRGARRKELAGVLRHVISFTTWESLAANGLSNRQAVETVEKWLRAL